MHATSYELYLKRGPTPGTIYPLRDKGLTIGRDPLSDILINDPEVSRQHALLSRTPTGDYRIQDLGSTNGTYVDGNRLGNEPMILHPSNTITMGGAVTLVFRERSGSGKESDQGDVKASPRMVTRAVHPDERNTKKPVEAVKKSPQDAGQREPSYQNQPQPVVYPTSEDIPRPTQIEIGIAREPSPNLILGLVLLLLCGCVSILVFLMYLGGDWFFREIGLVP